MIDNIARMVILLSCLYIVNGSLRPQGYTWSMEGKDLETPQAPTMAIRANTTQLSLYQEDFNDGKALGWKDPWGFFYGVIPTDEDGYAPYLFNQENHFIEGGADLFCWYTEKTFSDFIWTLDMRDGYSSQAHFHEGRRYGSGGSLALIFRADKATEEPGSYYAVVVSRWPALGVMKETPEEPKPEPIGKRFPFSLNTDPQWPQWHRFRIKAQGSSISVYLDDMEKPKITLQDNSIKEGYIGFKVSHFPNYWLIDNIEIRPL